jgi:hypothetical protein
MKSFSSILLLLISALAFGQSNPAISIMDFVKIKNDQKKEALYFYEHNWKAYRNIALQKGYIKAYQLLTTIADSAAGFDILLITEYTDSLQLKYSEQRFQEIIKKYSPDGPNLLNDLKPADFRQILYSKKLQSIFSAS